LKLVLITVFHLGITLNQIAAKKQTTSLLCTHLTSLQPVTIAANF